MLDFTYRRMLNPGSVTWHVQCTVISESSYLAAPGLIDQSRSDNELSFVFAVLCDPDGSVDESVKEAHEDLADDRFRQLLPDQMLA
jgi:hypothetical protein